MLVERFANAGTDSWTEASVDSIRASTDNALATGPFGSSIGSQFFKDSGVPLIRGGNLSNDGSTYLVDEDFVFVSEQKASEFSRSVVYLGDLIFTCWGTINQIGLVSSRAAYSRYIVSNKQMKFTPDPSKADSTFLFYLFSGANLQRQIKNQSIGTSVPGFNLGRLRALRFRVPPLREQKKIAEALSDADFLTRSLEQLVAKKRELKEGVMQELFTGQKRLVGFSRNWKQVSLGDAADLLKGNGLSRNKVSTTASRPCILYGELFTTYRREIARVVSRTNSLEGLLSVSGDVLMPGSTTTTGIDLAIASALLVDSVALGGDINVIRRKSNDYDSVFLANYLTYAKRHSIAALTQGVTIHHLYGRDLRRLVMQLPPLLEQIAIGTVLSNMEAEISALEEKLAKARNIKQGMMQELLAGRICLV